MDNEEILEYIMQQKRKVKGLITLEIKGVILDMLCCKLEEDKEQ
jgi:hypothetical protein